MNPSQHWTQLVNTTMSQRSCDYAEAWRITARAHPAAAILMSAYGATRSAVQFFNSSREGAARVPARQEFRRQVEARMVEAHCDYTTAFNFVERQNAKPPGLKAVPEFANDASGNPPVFSPRHKQMFHLPMDATPDECAAAWAGNGSTAAPVNPGKVFAALAEFIQKQKSLDYEAAITQAKGRFPALWALVEQLAKQNF